MATSSQDKYNEKFNDKFASLINPIKDLAQNWNVDVASLLEDYISELGFVRISFEDDPTGEVMNFVEAALLIQNSASVYGRKVDYLFNLVMQLLDHLKCRSNNPLLSRKRVVIRNTENVDFTSVEDIVEDKNLNLKETTINNITAFTVARMPIEYLSVDKDEKSFPLYNAKDLLIGNRHDFKLNCWKSSYFKSMCEDLNTITNKDPISSALIKQEPLDFLENEENQFAQSDCDNWGFDDNSFHDNDSEEEPNVETNAEKENKLHSSTVEVQDVKKYGLAITAEKALKEWDPLYAHENIKHRLRTIRKNPEKTIVKRTAVTRPKKKASKKNICAYLNDCTFSNASNLPAKLSQMTDGAESLINLIHKEDKRRKENKLDKISDSSDKNGQADNEDDQDKEVDDYPDNDDGNHSDDESSGNHNDFDDMQFNNNEDEEPNLNRSQFDTTFDAFISKETDKFLEQVLDEQQLSESEKIRKKWEDYLSDKLQDEEKYVAFNVREYTTKLLNAFAPNNSKQTINFSRVMEHSVANSNKAEASRLFFASLQLANNYNISIEQNSAIISKTFDITLLSRKQNFEAFDG